MTDNETLLSGEQRYSKKRRAFWRYMILTMVLFMLGGLFSGYIQSTYRNGEIGLWLPLAAGIALLAALAWFTWDFFVNRVDELDLMDNLWAHLIGQYGALTVFMIWYFLADLGLIATFPTAIGIVLALIGSTFLVYGLRKLGLR